MIDCFHNCGMKKYKLWVMMTKVHYLKSWLSKHSPSHCKYIQCNFYTFYVCPTFHCNLTVLLTFNYCSKYTGINVKLIYSFFYCNFYIGLRMANTCKVYTFYICPVSTVISLYINAVQPKWKYVTIWRPLSTNYLSRDKPA